MVNTTSLSIELEGLVSDNQKTIGPLLDSLQQILATLNANQASLDQGLALLGPFYRVFTNTIGNGRWFDNYICNFSAVGIVRARRWVNRERGVLVNRLSPTLTRIVTGVVVVAVVVGAAFYFLSGGSTKTVTANFASAVGVYPGTPVEDPRRQGRHGQLGEARGRPGPHHDDLRQPSTSCRPT